MPLQEGNIIKSNFEDQLLVRIGETITLRTYTETLDGDDYLSSKTSADTVHTVRFSSSGGFDTLENNQAGNFDIGEAILYTKTDFPVDLSQQTGGTRYTYDVIRNKDSTLWELTSEEGRFDVGDTRTHRKFILQRRQQE